MTAINSNSTSSWTQTKYAKTVASLVFTRSVAMSLANTELLSSMPDGDTIVRATTSFLGIQTYTPNNTVTYSDLSLGNESLVINDTPMVAFTLDRISADDAGWNIKQNTMENVAKLLREYLDGKFFNQVLNAGYSHNGGVAVTISKTTAYDEYSNAIAGAINNGADEMNLVLVTDAFQEAAIGQNAVNSTFALSDGTFVAGYTNKRVGSAELYRSENLTMVGTFIFGATPTDGDVVKINGYQFTMKTTLGATAGQVLIGANATASGANLAAAINGTTPGTSHVALSASDRNKFMRSFSATASTGTVTFTSRRGYRGASAFTKTMTSASNKFGAFTIYNVVMQKGAINLVLRDSVESVNGRIPGSTTYEYLTWSRFGLKVFSDGAEVMVLIPVIARAAE